MTTPQIILTTSAAALGAYMFLAEPYSIDVRELTFEYPNLPPAFDGYTILHFSDTHIRKLGTLERRLIDIISSREVDSCFVTGDVTAHHHAPWVFKEICSHIRYRDKLAFILGNSEHKPWVDSPRMARDLTFEGITLLNNANMTIERGGEKIRVCGVDDPYELRHDLDKAFEGTSPEDFIIFLTHCPSITPDIIKRGGDLILAGHTHGGQIRLPFFGPMWTHMLRNSFLNDGVYDSERLTKLLGFDAGGANLFVTRGIGTSKVHVRFACKPDLAFITLKIKK